MAPQRNNVKFLQFRIDQLMFKVRKLKLNHNNMKRSKLLQTDSLQTNVTALAEEVNAQKETVKELKTELQTKCDSETNTRRTAERLKQHYESTISRMQAYHDLKMLEEDIMYQRQTRKLIICQMWKEEVEAELEKQRGVWLQVMLAYQSEVENLHKRVKSQQGQNREVCNVLPNQDNTNQSIWNSYKCISQTFHAKEKGNYAVLLGSLNQLKDALKDNKSLMQQHKSELNHDDVTPSKLLQMDSMQTNVTALTEESAHEETGKGPKTEFQFHQKCDRETNGRYTFKALQEYQDFVEALVSEHMEQFGEDVEELNECKLNVDFLPKDQNFDSETNVAALEEHQESNISFVRERIEKLEAEVIKMLGESNAETLQKQAKLQQLRQLKGTLKCNETTTMEPHNLKGTTEKARRHPLHKVTSWMNEKVWRKNNRVIPKNAEEPRSLLPGGSRPLGLPDHDIESPVNNMTMDQGNLTKERKETKALLHLGLLNTPDYKRP